MTWDFTSFNSIPVISGRWEDDNERLCAMEPCHGSPREGLNPDRTRDEDIPVLKERMFSLGRKTKQTDGKTQNQPLPKQTSEADIEKQELSFK